MKVKELIDFLTKLDQEKNVWLMYNEGIYEELFICTPEPTSYLSQKSVDEIRDTLKKQLERGGLDDIQVGDYCLGPGSIYGETL